MPPLKISPRTPVLVGVGAVTQKERDPLRACQASDLMIEAVRRAGRDSRAPRLLADAGYIAVPKGRWDYGNPAGSIAHTIGARRAQTVLSHVGVLQQTLIGEACRRIADGETEVALVAGGEAGYRLRQADLLGLSLRDAVDEGIPDLVLRPAEALRHPAELRAGLDKPIGIYAMIDSAWRTRVGRSLDDHLARIAGVYSRFSEIATTNPHAWHRKRFSEDAILEHSARNQLQAFPYSRLHCSSWSVDQAAALLFASATSATAAGVPPERWVFPIASTESNHMLHASGRACLAQLPGARVTARMALEHAGLAPADVDLVDLYSPFPIAVELYAREAGLPLDRDLTVTGAMPFAGGPYNNYVLQATARLAVLLRAGRGKTGLISAASGVLTKQAFAIWSTTPARRPFLSRDVSAEVAGITAQKPILAEYDGPAVVAAHTVLYERGVAKRGIAILDVDGARRTVAIAANGQNMVRAIERGDFNGTRVEVRDGRFDF